MRKLPKLIMAVAAGCHLILSCSTATGMSGDQSCLHDVLVDAWTRAPVKTLVADAAFDTEANHKLARLDPGLEQCLIPPHGRRPTHNAPTTPFRAEAAIAFKLATMGHRQTSGQRAQNETANSMLKRNLGTALRAHTPERREREIALRSIVHNPALIPRGGLP